MTTAQAQTTRLSWRALFASSVAWAATALTGSLGVLGADLPASERVWTVLSASLGANPGAVTLGCTVLMCAVPRIAAGASAGRGAFAGLVVGATAVTTLTLAFFYGIFDWFFHDTSTQLYSPLVLAYLWAASGLPLWGFLAAFVIGPGRPRSRPAHTRATVPARVAASPSQGGSHPLG